MSYKYFTSSSPVYLASSSNIQINELQAAINEQFYNAPDAYTILEEVPYASQSYSNVEVRINHVIDTATGTNLGDDWKALIFKDLSHSSPLGTLYSFDENSWLNINSEIIKNYAARSTVRRCDNQLRWIGSDGTYYYEPCIIDYRISRPRDSMGAQDPVTPEGWIDIFCQFNDRTVTIKGGQRFIVGPIENRVALKVFAWGVRNYLNQKTLDDGSPAVIQFTCGGNYVDPLTDDLVNGIADAYLDYDWQPSGSGSIVVTPTIDSILENTSASFTVNYASGSTILSGSFVFTVDSSTTASASQYIFDVLGKNSFEIFNVQKSLGNSLNIKASGSSGSRLLAYELRGAW